MKNLFVKWMVVGGLVFGMFFGMGAGLTRLMQPAPATEKKEPVEVTKQVPADGERTNILVLGVDARPGEKNSRSDTMLLVSIDPKLDKAAIISIPRDTKIELKNGSVEKICAANFIGGPKYAVEKVEELMQTKIDHYVEMDFKGFKDIVNTLGGVTIDVPRRMYKPLEDIDLHPGEQKLDGKKALAFVRFRDYTNGDIDRTHQQQVFIKALANEVLKPRTITKLPGLARQFKQYVETDIGFTDVLKMASWAPGFNSDSIITQTLPGCFYDEVDGKGRLMKSYWLADKDQATRLLDDLFAGKTVAVVQQSPPPVVVGPVVNDEEDPEDEDSTTEDRVGDVEDIKDIEDIAKQRPHLPSPGHNDEIEIPSEPVVTDPRGPEGYI
jgi:LCP family protein required for cell wall assembly